MAMLCQLVDPAGYRVMDWSIEEDPAGQEYWFNLFDSFPKHLEPHLRRDGLGGEDFDTRWQAFCQEYAAGIQARRENPTGFGELNTVTLVHFREGLLRKYGWPDPFKGVKQRENKAAAEIYPEVVSRIEALPADQRWEMLFRGLAAGNIFDLGATPTIEMYKNGETDFFTVIEKIPHRPWFIDDADRLGKRLITAPPYKQVLFFVDNSGSDIVLGIMPLVRELAKSGTRTVLAANTVPALNDITIEELPPLLGDLADRDPLLADFLADKRITTVDSGGDMPLIDLSRVSDECNAVAAESDLIVLEGMGRGVESNWSRKFKCDVWRVALLKDEAVAAWLGGKLFDVVCRFDPAC